MSRKKIAAVRLTEVEHAALKALAARRGTDLSDLLRGAVLGLLRPQPQPLPQARTVGTHACVIWAEEGAA